MNIKKVEEFDIKEIVEVHKQSFQNFFLTKLGDNFLYIYYDCVRANENSLLLGAYTDNHLVGFCASVLKSRGFNKQLIKKNLLRFFIAGLVILFTKPLSIIRLYKNLQKTALNISDEGEYAELLSIGISPNMQGQGIGKKLLIELQEELKIIGCANLSLTTDYYNNEKAIKFYKGLGFEIYYEFEAYPKRKMFRMIKTLK